MYFSTYLDAVEGERVRENTIAQLGEFKNSGGRILVSSNLLGDAVDTERVSIIIKHDSQTEVTAIFIVRTAEQFVREGHIKV